MTRMGERGPSLVGSNLSEGLAQCVLPDTMCSTQLARERIANPHWAMANFPFGSRFALEGSLLEPTTPVFQPHV